MQTVFTDKQLEPKVKRWLRQASFVIDADRLNRFLGMPTQTTIPAKQTLRVLKTLKTKGEAVTGDSLGGKVYFSSMEKKAKFFEVQANAFWEELVKEREAKAQSEPKKQKRLFGIF